MLRPFTREAIRKTDFWAHLFYNASYPHCSYVEQTTVICEVAMMNRITFTISRAGWIVSSVIQDNWRPAPFPRVMIVRLVLTFQFTHKYFYAIVRFSCTVLKASDEFPWQEKSNHRYLQFFRIYCSWRLCFHYKCRTKNVVVRLKPRTHALDSKNYNHTCT